MHPLPVRDLWEEASREILMKLLFFMPVERRKRLERWIRGRAEYRRLTRADCAFVSWGKSGRTWLRVMLSRFYQIRHGLPESMLLEFDNLNRLRPEIPRIFFTHNNYLRDYTGNWENLSHFYGKKTLLLVRDPRDVAVSQFFQWKYRMRPGKKLLNDYPRHGSDISLYDFVMDPKVGLPRIIAYFNGWVRERDRLQDMLVVRYEDMRAHPEAELGRILSFLGTPGTEDEIREAVGFASYENMKKLEQKKVFWLSGSRVVAADRSNPDSYKVRRAKVGGYRDYFDDRQVSEIDRIVETLLDPSLGYAATPAARELTPVATSAPAQG